MPLFINPIYSHGGSASKLQVQIDAINDELQIISEALVGTGKMQYKGAYIAGEEDMDALLDDILDGDTSDGVALSEIPDELKDEVVSKDDYDDILNNIFGG